MLFTLTKSESETAHIKRITHRCLRKKYVPFAFFSNFGVWVSLVEYRHESTSIRVLFNFRIAEFELRKRLPFGICRATCRLLLIKTQTQFRRNINFPSRPANVIYRKPRSLYSPLANSTFASAYIRGITGADEFPIDDYH